MDYKDYGRVRSVMCRQSDRRRGTALWNGQLSEELACERDLEGEADLATQRSGGIT